MLLIQCCLLWITLNDGLFPVLPFGAVLEVTEHNASFSLRANTAVLHLLQLAGQMQDSMIEEWLEWEATELQVRETEFFRRYWMIHL